MSDRVDAIVIGAGVVGLAFHIVFRRVILGMGVSQCPRGNCNSRRYRADAGEQITTRDVLFAL